MFSLINDAAAQTATTAPATSSAVTTAAPTGAVSATDLAGSVVHDMSAWGLFMQADIVVKAVMIGLILASLWSWAIIFEKYMKMKALRMKADRFEREFWESDALDSFHERNRRRLNHPLAVMFAAGMEEWFRGPVKDYPPTNLKGRQGIKERIASIMEVARNRELDKLESGLTFLSTTGSAAPFIGLFGTVWGIMNSFTAIAASKNTNLAVVAPGIAEALFATAIGLFAAIPAVMAYNKFSREISQYAGRMEDFSTEFLALLSRQLD